MAPLSKAKRTTLSKTLEDGTKVYQGTVDSDWMIMSVPFGGYTMSILLNAASNAQASSAHPDPVHIDMQFLRAIAVDDIEAHVRTIRVGKQYTNLTAELVQQGIIMATASLIFGVLEPVSTGPISEQSLSYPISHTPICPLATHPANMTFSPYHWAHKFTQHYKTAEDPYFETVNEALTRDGRNDEGMKVGMWLEIVEDEHVTADIFPFFMDSSPAPSATLPKEFRNGTDKWWYPTLNIAVEFRVKLPLTDSAFDPNTFGVFARKRHMLNGRHSETVEVWTAPSRIGVGGELDKDWREKMVCVAVGGQMGLLVNPAMNDRYAKRPAKL